MSKPAFGSAWMGLAFTQWSCTANARGEDEPQFDRKNTMTPNTNYRRKNRELDVPKQVDLARNVSVSSLEAYCHDALLGAASGLFATVPMSIYMATGHRLLPWYERYAMPPRQITIKMARLTGAASRMDKNEQTIATAAAHFGYGAAMGGLYGIVTGDSKSRTSTTGIAFGLAVWAGSYLGLLPALGILRSATDQPMRRNAVMIGAHVVWGAALACVSNRMERNEDEKKYSARDSEPINLESKPFTAIRESSR